jgi:hypothetical protein
VGAVLPAHPPLVDELEERLVDQRRRLQRVALALAAEVPPGQQLQLAADERQQAVERRAVAIAPGDEQVRDLPRGGWLGVQRSFLGRLASILDRRQRRCRLSRAVLA